MATPYSLPNMFAQAFPAMFGTSSPAASSNLDNAEVLASLPPEVIEHQFGVGVKDIGTIRPERRGQSRSADLCFGFADGR